MKLTDCKKYMRVALHPATDWYMRGERFGTIVNVGRKYALVRMDRSQVAKNFRPDDLVDNNGWPV